jgi:6-pyruvoyltetrahydropterin/6-carboxytetrahydropterin synthase
MTQHLITREIGIDMGHRVTFHGSKCRNLHGHRYTIQATCSGPLYDEGEQQGMVLDFGFLKDEMMLQIDSPCDHGFCFWVEDELVRSMFCPQDLDGNFWYDKLKAEIKERGYSEPLGRDWSKIYVVPFVPTAENLARHWFDRLAPRVYTITQGQAALHNIKVWETPNCSAEYPGPD